jgi:hypothetical protein
MSPESSVKIRELAVTTLFTEQHLAGREVEDQTEVGHQAGRVLLWIAVKSVLNECFSAWAGAAETPRDRFIRQAGEARNRAVQELDRLIFDAYGNPLGLKAVARVTQLGINARRTLDLCLERLLHDSASASSEPAPPGKDLKIDWALGGLAEWPQVYPFGFEEKMAMEFTKHRTFYSTERNARKDITAKQIANIFCTTDHVIEALETKALGSIRNSFKHSEALDEYSQDFLASH